MALTETAIRALNPKAKAYKLPTRKVSTSNCLVAGRDNRRRSSSMSALHCFTEMNVVVAGLMLRSTGTVASDQIWLPTIWKQRWSSLEDS